MMVPTSKCKIQPCRQVSANKSRYLFIDWKSPDQSKIQARSRNQLSMKLARDLNPHDSNSLFFLFQICLGNFCGIFSYFLGFSGIDYEIKSHLRCSPLATVPRHHHQATEPRLCQRGPRRSQLQPFPRRTAVPAPQRQL